MFYWKYIDQTNSFIYWEEERGKFSTFAHLISDALSKENLSIRLSIVFDKVKVNGFVFTAPAFSCQW